MTVALRDLEARMRTDRVPVLCLDARLAVTPSSAFHFLYASLGLPMEAGRISLGTLLPKNEGTEDKTTIIIDHFEDIMHFSDAAAMIRSIARELYALDIPNYRVVVCVCPEDAALKVVEYNGCTKIRWCFLCLTLELNITRPNALLGSCMLWISRIIES
jgi:hypothetical protein